MDYGERIIGKGLKGPDVVELQIRLAGFLGTAPDGDFGAGTEKQVMTFQRDYMKSAAPTGKVDAATMQAIDDFADKYPIDFEKLKCPCGKCEGFGSKLYKGQYYAGKPKAEAYYRYEYPGVHRMLLWASRALFFYQPGEIFTINSCYRCSINNKEKGRTSTNHHGKAIDIDTILKPGEDHRDDMNKCNRMRDLLVQKSNAQVGWQNTNRKSLEPADIAPTWVHYDVRSYESKYLTDDFFCSTLEALNNRKPIKI